MGPPHLAGATGSRHNPEPPVEVESYVKLYFRCRLYSRNIQWSTHHGPQRVQPATGLVGTLTSTYAGGASRSAFRTASAARIFTPACVASPIRTSGPDA